MNRLPFAPSALLVSILFTGCCTRLPAGKPDVDTALEADRAFARLAAAEGPSVAYGRFADARSLRIEPTGPNIEGRESLVKELAGLGRGEMTWTPRAGEQSGELGWTWGDFQVVTPKGPRTGRYLTVWRKTRDGWKVAADFGAAP